MLACVACAVLAGIAVPGPAVAADEVPALPSGDKACVGSSPATVGQPVWGQLRMNAEAVWPLSKGLGVRVAIVDSGVSALSPALSGAVLPGRDVVAGGRADADCKGRGTVLAGLVAARPRKGSALTGVAPDVEVLPIRIAGADGKVDADRIADGLTAAVEGGAEVVVVGVGVPTATGKLRQAADAAEAADVVVVAAVSGDNEPQVWYPAAYPTVIAVNGETPDGKVTVVAPAGAGVDLTAPGAAVSLAPVGDGHYAVAGTAVAAAYTGGAAALVRTRFPKLTAKQVRTRLEETAEHPLRRADLVTMGAGSVDAYAAVAGLDRQPDVLPVDVEPLALPPVPVTPAGPRIAAATAGGVAVAAALTVAILAWVRQSRRRRAGES